MMSETSVAGQGPRIVVIGAGVAGLSAAWQAALFGARSVTVLERSAIAAGSSALSAGIFNRQTFDPKDLAFRVESGRMFEEIERSTDFRITRCGYMRLARSPEQWEKVLRTVEAGDYPDTELLAPDRVAELVPGMRVDDVVGAMYGPRDGYMDGPELCNALLRLGRELGVEFKRDAEVRSAVSGAGGVTLETAQGRFEADVVINAAGSWLAEVGDLLGAPVPIDNQLHEIVMFNVPSLRDRRVPTVQTYFPGSGEDAVYVRPEGEGRFLVGLHSYESTKDPVAPGTAGRQVSEEYLGELVEAAMDRFPGWDDAGIESGWSGIYPLSPDGEFIIGPSPANDRVVTLGGLGGVGLTVSAAAGRLAAEWAVFGEGRLFPFADTLLPGRFEGA